MREVDYKISIWLQKGDILLYFKNNRYSRKENYNK